MIAPHALLKLNRRIVRFSGIANLRCHGAALATVEPAVGPPGQRVGDRVGILHAEASEQHIRIGIRHIVAIAVGIVEQIRRL